MFHVKPGYGAVWRRAQYCLRQRNALLKRDKIDPGQETIWTREYADAAEGVEQNCKDYLAAFSPLFRQMMAEVTGISSLELIHQRGWPQTSSLLETLRRSGDNDRLHGYTRFGHHRADFRLVESGVDASKVLSRGQIKLAAVVMTLSQGILLRRETGKTCVLLIDDLGSELDALHRGRLATLIRDLGEQVVFTAIDVRTSEEFWGGLETRMFHVEQGVFRATARELPARITQ
jgi:DNA replication and repair protein RecF